jgi:hypothetical protein
MSRIPYEVVVIEADRLIVRMAIAPTPRQAGHFWNLYIGFITACGWTDREFDLETLRRVDAAWENLRRQIWN